MIRDAIHVSEFECEIDEHDAQHDRTAVANLPDGKGGTFLICEACLNDIFETVTRPTQH